MNYQELLKHIEEQASESLKFIQYINKLNGLSEDNLYGYFTFTSNGRVYPDFIDALIAKKLSGTFCSASKSFWIVRETLPIDVVQKFLMGELIQNRAILLTFPEIKEVLKKYLKKDLI